MSRRPEMSGNPVPQEFIDVFYDDDESIDGDNGELEDEFLDVEEGERMEDMADWPVFVQRPQGSLQRVGTNGDAGVEEALPIDESEDEDADEDWERAHRIVEDEFLDVEEGERMEDMADLPVFVQRPEGSLQRVGTGGDAGVEEAIPIDESEDKDADEDWERAHRIVEDAMSPLVEILNPVEALRRRSTASVRGRGCGRVRGLGGRGGGGNERRWMRGEVLEEMYVDDADLPLNIQEQIRAHLSGRVKNARRRMAYNVEEENEINESNEWDFDENEEFVWRRMDEWNGARCKFVPESTGPTVLIQDPYEAMHAIWTDDIIAHIAAESNRYAESVLAQQRPRFMRDWFATNLHEIWTLIAFWIMLGIIRMPSIKSCFTRNPLLRTDIFRTLFTEGRYWDVNAAFHLAEGTDPNNPLHAMGPIIDHLNNKFRELYQLNQEICIDESLTLWKGPVSFQQYIKTKAAKFGIKTYELCESSTGYLWAFFVYVGRTTGAGLPSRVSTVLRLIRPLLNLGHTLYMDNWFNCPSLARWLKRRNTDCVGTLRPSRKGVPEVIKRAPLQEGQFVARGADDVMVVALQDRKRVTCISTFHDVTQEVTNAKPGRPVQHKLSLIKDYNQAMGGVDKLDSMLEAYLVERKQCVKWTRKLFKRLLNISIQNARIIVEKSTNAKLDSLAFRLALVEGIMNRHLPNVPVRPTGIVQQRRNPFPLQRLTERHFIRRIPITDEIRVSTQHRTSLGRRNCVWCTHKHKRRRKTVYECEPCQVALCLENCFEEFHTEP